MIQNEPSIVSAQLSDFLRFLRKVEIGELYKMEDSNDLMWEVKLNSLRDIAVTIVHSQANVALKTIATRLLLRIGFVSANSYCCLLAAEL